MIRTIKTVVRAGAIALLFAVYASAYDDGDWQIWAKGTVEGKLFGNLSGAIEQEMRFGDNMSENYDNESYVHLDYTFTDWFQLGIGFREVNSLKSTARYDENGNLKSDHYWTREHCPTLDAVFACEFAGWKLDDRVRVEHREKDEADNYFRYRNRIRLKTPCKLSPIKINPYVAWETLYEDDDNLASSDRLNGQRLYTGVGVKLTAVIKGDLYYLYQRSKKSGDWYDINVFGITLSAVF